MKKNLLSFLVGGVVMPVLIGILGCAAKNPEKNSLAVHEMLVKAGFTYKVAKTAEQQEHLRQMPQKKLLRHVQPNETTYYYVDAKQCNCVFVGDEAAKNRYHKLKHEKMSDIRKSQASEGEEAGVFYRGEDPASVMEDIDEGIAPGF